MDIKKIRKKTRKRCSWNPPGTFNLRNPCFPCDPRGWSSGESQCCSCSWTSCLNINWEKTRLFQSEPVTYLSDGQRRWFESGSDHSREIIASTKCCLNQIRTNLSWCPIHVVTFTLISSLSTDYIQKRRREPGLFSFYYCMPGIITYSWFETTRKY